MKKIIALGTVAAVATFATAAHADDFPNWPASATCTSIEHDCARFEAKARGEVAGVWPTLPPQVRQQCLSETEALQPSYRMLLECLTLEMQRNTAKSQSQR